MVKKKKKKTENCIKMIIFILRVDERWKIDDCLFNYGTISVITKSEKINK